MHLLTLILGIVLLPEASTLNCYQCIPGESGTCTDTTTQCPLLVNECAAHRTLSYAGHFKASDVTAKSCVLPEECGEHSLNFGDYRFVVNNKCCTTDLCNTQPAPEPSPTAPNGKKCFSCDGLMCTSTLNCLGDEDYCISGTGKSDRKNTTLKGCTSRIFCSNTQTARITRGIATGLSCCQGDYCNSASSTSAGLLLLVTPLISLILN